jgi:FeS assembly protein IscX
MPELYWEATYAIAMALIEYFPDHNPEDVGLNELAQIIQSLPGFNDEPGLETKQILLDIQTVWYEEATSL